jgi:hypothetical protein
MRRHLALMTFRGHTTLMVLMWVLMRVLMRVLMMMDNVGRQLTYRSHPMTPHRRQHLCCCRVPPQIRLLSLSLLRL